MPDGNPLIAERQDSTTAYSGIGIAESVMDIYNGVESKSWVEGGIGVAGTGLEALSLAMDPVGTLLQYAVSWLMEHVKPLSDALDWLAGDADQIAAYAQTWKNIGQATNAVATDYAAEVTNGTAGWEGAAADAYRARSKEQQDRLKAAGTGAETIGTVVQVVGVLVGAVREIVRDLVAECVATLIARIPQWIAEIGGTLGIATPHVVGSAVALISKWVNRIKDFILKLTRSLENLRPLLKNLGDVWESIRKALPGSPNGGTTTPSGASPVTSPKGSDIPSGTSPAPGDRGGWGGGGWVDEANSTPAARAAYERIANSPQDVDAISRNTGLDSNVLEEARQNLFVREHDVANGPGPENVERGRFTPNEVFSDLWDRARDGRLTPEQQNQFRSLMAHEYVESRLMRDANLPYLSSHPSSWGEMGSQWNPDDPSAHLLAPHSMRSSADADLLSHWGRYGLTPPPGGIAPDLSNLDDVVRAAREGINR